MSDYRVDQMGNILRVSDGATIPPSPDNRDYMTYQSWVSAGNTADPYTPPPPALADYEIAAQALLDNTAKQRDYDDILSACSYAASTNAKFKTEAEACMAWRDAIWAQCYSDLAAVQAGQMAQPTVPDFVASLPQLTWPD